MALKKACCENIYEKVGGFIYLNVGNCAIHLVERRRTYRMNVSMKNVLTNGI